MSVYNLPYRALGIVVSDIAGEKVRATEKRVLEHERVNERLMESWTVLPCRFNTLFKDKERLLVAVGGRYAELQTDLNRLQGKREYGLKVLWPGKAIREKIEENCTEKNKGACPVSGNSSGKRFMQRLYRRYRIDKAFSAEAARQIEYIDGFFTDCVVTKKLEKLRTENLLLSAYYLVKKEKEEELKAAFARLRSRAKGFKCLLSGPWPPYNFIQNAGLLG